MSTAIVGVATFLHVVASVVFFGHYLLLGSVYLPGLRRRLRGHALVAAVDELDLAARPWLVGAVVVFGVSGTVLMLLNPAYGGWVGLIDNPWATLILAKHVVVGLLVVGAILIELAAFPAAVDLDATDAQRAAALDRLLLALRVMAAGGIVVLALTSAARWVTG